MYVVLAIGDLIATSGAVAMYLQGRDTWQVVGLALLSVGFNLAVVDLAVSRIDLEPDELRIVELLRRRSIPKRDVASVKVEGGSVFLQLQDGQWFKVPDTGRNSLSMRNSIDAWLKTRSR
jgi:hypothetical protein